MRFLDIRSDTTTQPTEEMRRAMYEAVVDDDVYGDDPTINELEALAAEMMGKEAAMFVPSGTMGNQVSIMTWTQRGDEIIAGAQAHIVHYEAGAPGLLSGVNLALVDNDDTYIYPKDILKRIRPKGDSHCPKTALVCLENALCNGDVVPLDILREDYRVANENGIPVHLDGARIFNAALALGCDVKDIAACADSVMFCVSKGLCAPVGSLVCGTKEFIDRARFNRKILGGGMRQAGVLAACGLVALRVMTKRLHEDHENAQYLADLLNAIPGIHADKSKIKINMVFFKVDIPGFESDEFVRFMYDNQVKIYGILVDEYRFVTSNNVNKEDLAYIAGLVAKYADSKR